MTIVYKILSVVVNVVAMFLAILMVLSLPVLFSSTLNMLSGFMLVCIVLYGWFSFSFQRQVLKKHQKVKPMLRDMIKINGYISLFYSTIIIGGMLVFLKQPGMLLEQIKQMGVVVELAAIQSMLYTVFFVGLVLFVHILWTLALVRKFNDFFTGNEK